MYTRVSYREEVLWDVRPKNFSKLIISGYSVVLISSLLGPWRSKPRASKFRLGGGGA